MKNFIKNANSQRGFSLLEMAVVMAIVGTLLVSGVTSFSSRHVKDQQKKAQTYLDSIREALYWYAATTGHLPCPDIDLNGYGDEEYADPATDPQSKFCTALVGVLPWKEIEAPNAKGLDPWGNYFTYHIGAAYSFVLPTTKSIGLDTGTATDNNCDTYPKHCNIRVNENDVADTELVGNAPAVVVSHGKNGEGHYLLNTVPLQRSPAVETIADSKELENADGDVEYADPDNQDFIYVQGAGDDILLWLSATSLKSQLFDAGRLTVTTTTTTTNDNYDDDYHNDYPH